MRASRGSRRRSTAKRRTTACTPRCGANGSRTTPQFRAAVDELWPYALGVLPAKQRDALASRVEREQVDAVERGTHDDAFTELHDEMTMVRRSAPAGAQW